MTAWTQRSPHFHPAIRRFDRYTVLGRLALGGMAEVFLARAEDAPGGYVVIKRMRPRVAEDPELVEMFFDEARLAMQLSHPNICRVYDFGEAEGSYCIAMEWVNGCSLEDLFDQYRSGMPIPEALRIVACVAEGLHYAHRLRDGQGRLLEVVHRDVSPLNILVGFDGAVKLTDFGLAKSHAQLSNTAPGLAKGKLAFMAPEQWHERPVDARTDVFALGVCLYEALTGQHLYRHLAPVDTMHAICNGPVPSVVAHDPAMPPELDGIVQRALAKRPEDRFQSAAAMQMALEELLLRWQERADADRVGRLMASTFTAMRMKGPPLKPTAFGSTGQPGRSGALTPPRGEPAAAPPSAPASPQAFRAAEIEDAPPPLPPPPRPPSSVPPPVGSVPPPAQERNLPAWPFVAAGSALGLAAAATIVWLGIGPQIQLPLGDDPAPQASAATAQPPGGAEGDAPDAERSEAPTGIDEGARAKENAKPARLSITTKPWSEVTANGTSIGVTPVGEVVLPSGEVRLRFVDAGGTAHERVVELEPGEHEHLFVSLDTDGVADEPVTDRGD